MGQCLIEHNLGQHNKLKNSAMPLNMKSLIQDWLGLLNELICTLVAQRVAKLLLDSRLRFIKKDQSRVCRNLQIFGPLSVLHPLEQQGCILSHLKLLI